MATSEPQTQSYNHLPTILHSPSAPIILRSFEPEDNASLAQILSDPRNTELEADNIPRQMDLAAAASAVARMRDSASQPTVLSPHGKVVRGPGRVNLVVVYLGDEGTDEGHDLRKKGGLVVGLGGFGSIKDVSPATNEPVPEVEGQAREFLRVGDVGAMINADYRGRGFAVEAVRLAMEWGFKQASDGGLQLDKITATTLAANEPMVAVLSRKIGWEGKAGPPAEKEGMEEINYEMFAKEWEARK
ncbi:acetyltransferase [Xylariales sp. AK1849]|nr:acetyltransferase [Xylariales sp. AK1849]